MKFFKDSKEVVEKACYNNIVKNQVNVNKPLIKPFIEMSIAPGSGEIYSRESLFSTCYDGLAYFSNNAPDVTSMDVVSRRYELNKIWGYRLQYYIGICVSNLISSILYTAENVEEENTTFLGFSANLFEELSNCIGKYTTNIYSMLTSYSQSIIYQTNSINNYHIDEEPYNVSFADLYSNGFIDINTNKISGAVSDISDIIALEIYTDMLNEIIYRVFIKYGISLTETCIFDSNFCVFRDSICTSIMIMENEKIRELYPLSFPEYELSNTNDHMYYEKSLNWTDPKLLNSVDWSNDDE